jgi:hypothetical protein
LNRLNQLTLYYSPCSTQCGTHAHGTVIHGGTQLGKEVI